MKPTGETSIFEWPKGRAELWGISADSRGQIPPLIVYEEGWPHPWENPYRPLEDAPRLFEDLAALAEEAHEVGQRLAAEVDQTAPAYVWKAGTRQRLEAPDWSLAAEWDSAVQRKILGFVREYGPLRMIDRAAIGVRADDFLREAYALTDAIALAKEVHDLESGALDDTERRDNAKLRSLQTRLQMRVAGFLRGTSLILPRDAASGRLVAGHSCEDLVSACWLQFYEAFLTGKMWRVCKGCGRLFMVADARQEYHDAACRNRSHVRRSRQKSRDQKGGLA